MKFAMETKLSFTRISHFDLAILPPVIILTLHISDDNHPKGHPLNKQSFKVGMAKLIQPPLKNQQNPEGYEGTCTETGVVHCFAHQLNNYYVTQI